MRALAIIAFIVLVVSPVAPEANPGTFVRLPLQHPVANWFPVDIHSDGQWELAILTAESPPRVGVFDARQQRWIDGPRILPVTDGKWGVGDWDNDYRVEYAYLQGRTLFEFNPDMSAAESLWTTTYTPKSLTVWGRDSSGVPTVAMLGDSGGAPYTGEGRFLRVHRLFTGAVYTTLSGGENRPRLVQNYPEFGHEALGVYYSRAEFDRVPGEPVGANFYFHWIYFVGDDWSVTSKIVLPYYRTSHLDHIGDLWGLELFDSGFLDDHASSVICWLSKSMPPVEFFLPPICGAYNYSGERLWFLSDPQIDLYAGMAIYDFDPGDDPEIVLPLGDSSGWQLRNARNGVMIRVIEGLPPVDVETAPLIAKAQRDLFYIADSALFIYQSDVSTAIIDGPEEGVADNAGIAHLTLSAYPNPFNAAVTLSWSAEAEVRSLTIYNILGQSVRTYALSADTRELAWDGRDTQGRGVASGVYFARLGTRAAVQSVKLVLLR